MIRPTGKCTEELSFGVMRAMFCELSGFCEPSTTALPVTNKRSLCAEIRMLNIPKIHKPPHLMFFRCVQPQMSRQPLTRIENSATPPPLTAHLPKPRQGKVHRFTLLIHFIQAKNKSAFDDIVYKQLTQRTSLLSSTIAFLNLKKNQQ